MKIALAQIKSEIGHVESNVENHVKWINEAIFVNADLIVFPELSISGYAPTLAEKMAIDVNDDRLEVFKKISKENKISILIGVPLRTSEGIKISLITFQAFPDTQIYSKQKLHPDELPYFCAGNEHMLISFNELKIAPAICYESLDEAHLATAVQLGAKLYLASVAKGETGITKAYIHYGKMARKYGIPILCCNCIGACEDFLGYGNSAMWNREGILLKKLQNDKEGLLFYDL